MRRWPQQVFFWVCPVFSVRFTWHLGRALSEDKVKEPSTCWHLRRNILAEFSVALRNLHEV